MLTAIGYSDASAVTQEVKDGLFNIATLIPAVGFFLLALILWFWYPLHKARVIANVETLRKRREDSRE